MRTYSFAAALAAAALLLPACSQARMPVSRGPSPETAHVIVEKLLEHREELSLTREQVDDLAALFSQLRRDRGRVRIIALDRVPGKSVPRYERVYRTRADARRMALEVLTPPQLLEIDKILDPH